MTENKVVVLRQKDQFDDPLTEILRSGAKRLIAQAVEAEFEAFLADHADKMLADDRQRVVRHGHDPVRQIQTGIGPVDVPKPKARDRGASSESERIRYGSAIIPQWARRTKSLDALLPALYVRGVSAGDFQDVTRPSTSKCRKARAPGRRNRISPGRAADLRWLLAAYGAVCAA